MEINLNFVKEKLPKRPLSANKGTFGKALIIAGSKNYPGAAILSCMACARVGAGLITLATEKDTYKVAVPKIPFATFLEFSEIKDNIGKYDSVLIGPGLGVNDDLKLMINEWIVLKEFRNKKAVLDADCLNILSETPDWHKTFKTDAVLTPHPGEMSRLTGLSSSEIQNSREKVALDFAKKWQKAIILKGANTVIATSNGEIYQSEFANPLLATAGTGDVLSGIIAGLLAQGLSLEDAAICGVYIHGAAGEKLKGRFGNRGATALDLVETLPEVFYDFASFA